MVHNLIVSKYQFLIITVNVLNINIFNGYTNIDNAK